MPAAKRSAASRPQPLPVYDNSSIAIDTQGLQDDKPAGAAPFNQRVVLAAMVEANARYN
jgi:hypothetical protein